MASTGRRKSAALSKRLLQEPYRFDFFQAVRLLEWMASPPAPGDDRARDPVGYDSAPHGEAVRFRVLQSLSFAASAVRHIRPQPEPAPPDKPAPPPEMTVAFLGLTGPSGALPDHYTTLLTERMREKDPVLRDFYDLFNHRTISLFYRAWQKYRLPIIYEQAARARTTPKEDPFTAVLYSLVGWGTKGLRGRLKVDDECFLYYGGHFAATNRPAITLENVLCDYFEIPIQVEQFHGQWLYLSQEDRSRLPSTPCPEGAFSRLGADVVVGEKVWDVQSGFRLRAGPLSYAQFCHFMPSGDAFRPLCQITRTYVGAELDFDVQLVLQAADVPPCILARAGQPPRLGWNTWLWSQPFASDVTDAIFYLDE